MELQFEKSTCACLGRVLNEVRSLEQAQEIRLSDGMPDIGRVLGGWGQVLQRSKEWGADSVSLSAGMLVWVLYVPEDGGAPRWVEGWIPFSASWDLPQTAAEGKLRIQCLTRFVDARSVSARKIMVRAGLSAMVEAYVPMERQVALPGDLPQEVELRKVRYPLRLPREAGEKVFTLEEDLALPGSQPPMEKLVAYTLEPEVQEQRVLTDKAVFKGLGKLRVLYASSDGSLHRWDASLPFSQYTDLEAGRSQEAEVSIRCGLTSLEAERQDETHLHIKCGLTGQYLVDDVEVLELVEDAYSPVREVSPQTDSLDLHGVLESRKDIVSVEQTIPGDGELAVDVTFWPDFPRQRTRETGISLELAGTFQVLYLGADGTLQSAVSRWEGQTELPGDPACMLTAQALSQGDVQILMGGGDMKVRTELPIQTTVTAPEGLPMVTGLDLGDPREPAENRPSLILCRAGERDLWAMAKATGSTVSAIQAANHLQEDPKPGQMLLIPIL